MDQELNLNAWVLVGNTLHLVLRGPAQVALAGGPIRDHMALLDAALAPVNQQGMIDALRNLPLSDRTLLHDLCTACFDRLRDEAPAMLGMDRSTAESVLALLRP
jgi:hypothetical protein